MVAAEFWRLFKYVESIGYTSSKHTFGGFLGFDYVLSVLSLSGYFFQKLDCFQLEEKLGGLDFNEVLLGFELASIFF